MKNIYTFILCCMNLLHAMHEPFNKNAVPDQSVIELLNIASIKHNGTVDDIIKKTQEQWIRKSGTERWEIDKSNHPYHDQLIVWLGDNNFIQEISPQLKHYKYIVLMGGAAQRVKSRIKYIEELIQTVSFNKLIMLCGERPLDSHEEQFEMYAYQEDINTTEFQRPKTETDMMKYIAAHTQLPENKIEWHSMPMIDTGDNKRRRPTTEDTLKLWLAAQPQPGTCLIVSSQPHARYQEAVVKSVMPDEFEVHIAAPQSSTYVCDGDYLDNLARWLYQTWKLLNKSK